MPKRGEALPPPGRGGLRVLRRLADIKMMLFAFQAAKATNGVRPRSNCFVVVRFAMFWPLRTFFKAMENSVFR